MEVHLFIVFILYGFCQANELNETHQPASESLKEEVFAYADNPTDTNVARGQEWLLSIGDSDGGWKEDTARVITALALTAYPELFHESVQNKLHFKELELQIALAVAKNQTDHLPLFVNALLSVCEDPADFFGFNLTSKLKKAPNLNSDYSEALSYLALCNAGVKLNKKIIVRLLELAVLKESKIPDSPSIAALALICSMGDNHTHHIAQRGVRRAVKQLKIRQNKADGSFGNVYSSALALQVLNAAKADDVAWNGTLAKKFLLSQQGADGSFEGSFAAYFALPALAGSSLSQIRNINCSKKPNTQLEVDSNKEVDKPVDISSNNTIEMGILVKNGNETQARMVFFKQNASLYEILNAEFHCEWKKFSFGSMLISLNGLQQDEKNKKYWFILRNTDGCQTDKEEYLSTSAEKFYPSNGTCIILKYQSS